MPETTEEAVLAAVRDEVVAYGVRRATATSIAKRAGVSRVTVYRLGGTIGDLVMSAVFTELETLLRAVVDATPGEGTELDRIADECVRFNAALHDSDLFGALLRHDAEVLLPYLVDRLGRSQGVVRDHLRDRIAAGVAEGSIRPVDPQDASLVLVLALQSFAISARIVDDSGDPAALGTEIRRLVTGYLGPDPTPHL